MIIKEKDSTRRPSGKREEFGDNAERQMAFYLGRAFAEDRWVRLFHDLRLTRRGDSAQIDHLVLHRFGFVVVESKSVTGTIHVNKDGDFERRWGRNCSGMPSPILQAKRQARLLQDLLNDHKSDLRGKTSIRNRQLEFLDIRFRVLVAISDGGRVDCAGERPEELLKADGVTERIREWLARHEETLGIGGFAKFMIGDQTKSKRMLDDHVIPFTDKEMETIAEFLKAQDVPVREASPSTAGRYPGSETEQKRTLTQRAQVRDTTALDLKEADKGGELWTEEEEQRLIAAFHAGKSAKDLATHFGRTSGALKARAVRLGLIKYKSGWK